MRNEYSLTSILSSSVSAPLYILRSASIRLTLKHHKSLSSKLDTVGDGIKVMSTIFRMIREYKPLPFFGGFGLLLGIIGLILTISVGIDFMHTGIVARFPTLIGAVMLIIAGLLLIVAGIILDVITKNDRKAFVIDTNRFAFLKRHHS